MKRHVLIIFALLISYGSNMNANDMYKPDWYDIEINNGKISKITRNNEFSQITIEGKIVYQGKDFIMPGLCDAHCHLIGLGTELTEPNLKLTKSAEDCINIIANIKPNRGNWIVGRGWNQENWEKSTFPNKKMLDSIFPNTPVCLRRVDGHAAWVNSTALKYANISDETKNPQGGEIMRDKNGDATGILIDNAMNGIMDLIPKYNQEQTKLLISKASDALYQVGITEIHDIDVLPEYIKYYKNIMSDDYCGLKIQAYITAHNDEYLDANIEKYKTKYLVIRGVKFYADGSLGSRGASLMQNYTDRPESKGLLFYTQYEFEQKFRTAIKKGFEIAVHSIGDSANKVILDAYVQIKKENKVCPILRVEHCQIMSPDDIEKFAKYDIIASMQPIHCPSDARMAEKRLGSQRCEERGYKWKTILNSGAKLIAGSDFPIESHNPFLGIDAFVNRIPFNSTESWFPNERISIDEAVKAYTVSPRKYFNISERGKLNIGSDADIIIIDNDLSKPENISKTKVLMTIIDGKIVWDNNN